MTVPPDDARAACRAALLKACRVIIDRGIRGVAGGQAHLGFGECVQVDDAAACMAERERALFNAMVRAYNEALRDGCDANAAYDSLVEAGHAALAAAQGGTDE